MLSLRHLALALTLTILSPIAGWPEAFDCHSPLTERDAQALLKKVESRYDSLKSLEAKFFQNSLFVGLEQREASKGELFFQKPGKMNWLYAEPEEQRFVADGKSVWFYQPTLNQVTVDTFRDSFTTDLPVTFLLGLGRLSDSFTVHSACNTEEGAALDLQPKVQDSNLQKFVLLVRASDATPYGAKVLDLGGNETTIVLFEQKLNGEIAETQFAFTVPRGVDIIDNRAAGSPSATTITESSLVRPEAVTR